MRQYPGFYASPDAPAAPARPDPLTGITEMNIAEIPGFQPAVVPTDVISYDSALVMNYIQEFANLTRIPHPSHHPEKMNAYLVSWAQARGLRCDTDEAGNAVMFLPATPGYENAPTVIIQGHHDMVPDAEPGKVHDWENDPLDLIWNANGVKADGTTLGADNGGGVAFMMTFIDYADKFVHGPMRMICTADEEVGLLGAHALDARYLEGASYMINVDGGYGMAIISCAGGKYFDFSHKADWAPVSEGTAAYTLEFAGLKGGHSAGVGGGKANGLVAMANAILTLHQAGIEFSIASFTGGNANNAIPSASKAVLALKETDISAADTALAAFAKRFRDSYGTTEPSAAFTYGAAGTAPEKALSSLLSLRLVQLMSTVPNNIHTLLTGTPGTESSSNLGTLKLGEDEVFFSCLMRSSSTYQAEQLTLAVEALAELAGFDFNISANFATWPLKADNDLGAIAAEIYKDITGKDYALLAIHAGVECGEFSEKNEKLSIISTGVSGGKNAHSYTEEMNFDMVEDSIRFLVRVIATLAEK